MLLFSSCGHEGTKHSTLPRITKEEPEWQAQIMEAAYSIILDLRNSPGGILNQVLDIVNRFVDSGVTISLEGQQAMKFFAGKGESTSSYPAVVLVNGFTSAGSEIVAGVLQDHGRALIIGTTPAGNRTIQTIFPLIDGSALRLTTHVWKLPLARSVEDLVVVPDYDIGTRDSTLSVWKDGDRDAAIEVAIQVLSTAASCSKEDLERAVREIARKKAP